VKNETFFKNLRIIKNGGIVFARSGGFGGIFAIYCKNHDKTGGKLNFNFKKNVKI